MADYQHIVIVILFVWSSSIRPKRANMLVGIVTFGMLRRKIKKAVKILQ